jgi:uncharacterized RDD family membrane protein YckC
VAAGLSTRGKVDLMTQPSGWYDDPQDPTQLRYWDGVIWSSHVSPKISPTVAQSHIGMPYGVVAASARPQSLGSAGAQGPPTAQRGYDSPVQGKDPATGHHWPAYGQGPGTGQQQTGWQPHQVATTPDGVFLSGWWLRVVARVLDAIITFVLALPVTGWFYYRYLEGVVKWSNDLAAQSASGSTSALVLPPWTTYQYAFIASLITLLVAGVYEVIFLSRSGATPGKKVVGISVRLREKAGPPPMNTALVRTVCFSVMQLFSVVYLLDVLWPLWDTKKQALHDKVAATNVVMGPQPKRDS